LRISLDQSRPSGNTYQVRIDRLIFDAENAPYWLKHKTLEKIFRGNRYSTFPENAIAGEVNDARRQFSLLKAQTAL
jgi:hypothetical protein